MNLDFTNFATKDSGAAEDATIPLGNRAFAPQGGQTGAWRQADDWDRQDRLAAHPVAQNAPGVRQDFSRPLPIPSASSSFVANPLLACADPLFNLVARLHEIPDHPDVPGLRDSFADSLRAFEQRVIAAGCPNEDMLAARYVLCACIDEAVLTTGWGGRSAWSANSLLNIFHQEVWGGEKVFQIVERIRSQPARYGDLIEVVVTCIDLGFEGQYRVREDGKRELDILREELHTKLRDIRGEETGSLCSLDEVATGPPGLVRYVPIWVVWTGALILLIVIYSMFEFSIDEITHRVIEELNRIGRPNGS